MAGSLWACRAERPFLAPCRWLLFLGYTGSLATPWRGRSSRIFCDGTSPCRLFDSSDERQQCVARPDL